MSDTVQVQIYHPWHRFEDFRYAAPLDEYEQPIGSGRAAIRHDQYNVIRVTPKGVWLDIGCGEEKFVLRAARKKFACLTEAEAMESFIARKKRQLKILKNQAKHVEEVLKLADPKALPEKG